jgi:hypothetical protein
LSPYLDVIYSDIFHDYYNYIKEKFDREQAVLQNLLSTNFERIEQSLKTQMGQAEAMKYIFGNSPISRGNSYGRPWVHYSFKKGSQSHKTPLPDRLFYRIDERKKGFYISLRQYRNLTALAKRKENSLKELKRDKLERLYELTRVFDDVMTEIKNDFPESYIEPGKRTADRSGRNESEVGVFYFTSENTVERFSYFFQIFHNRFCDRVETAFGIEGLERMKVLSASNSL